MPNGECRSLRFRFPQPFWHGINYTTSTAA
jgi:hypothetical protein